MIALADRLGAAKLVTGHYARIADDGDGPAARRPPRTPPRTRPTCSPALRPESLAPPALPARRADQAGGARDRRRAPASRSPAGRRARTSASSPARASASSCAGTPASRSVRARSWIRRGRRLGEHNGHHNFTVGQRRGPAAWAAVSRCYVLRTDAADEHGGRRLARASSPPGGCGSAERRLHRPAPSGSTGSASATTRPSATAGWRSTAIPSEAIVALAEPVDGAGAGQVACLLDGDLVVGHGRSSA